MSNSEKTQESYRKHEEAQRSAWASLQPIERLRWLQQAKEFARRYLGAAGKQGPGGSSR